MANGQWQTTHYGTNISQQHHHHHLVLSSDVKRITQTSSQKNELCYHEYEHNDKYIDCIQQKLTTKTLNYSRNGNN